jgi:hypothetical protein
MLRGLLGVAVGVIYWLAMVAAGWSLSNAGHADGFRSPGILVIPSLLMLPFTGIVVSMRRTENLQTGAERKVSVRAKYARVLLALLFISDVAVLVMMVVADASLFKAQLEQGFSSLMGDQMRGLWLWGALLGVWHFVLIHVAMDRL